MEGQKPSRLFRGAEQVALRALCRDKVKSMNRIFALQEDELRGGIYRRILLLMGKNRWAWQMVGAATGLFGGLLFIILGVLVWAVVGLIAPAGALGSFLNVAGTILFLLPLPLLALGAHCLDLLEKKAPVLPLPADSQPDALRPTLRPHMTSLGSRAGTPTAISRRARSSSRTRR
jgi:hypothetical protein